MLFPKVPALAFLYCFGNVVVGTGFLNFDKTEIKLVQSAFKSAMVEVENVEDGFTLNLETEANLRTEAAPYGRNVIQTNFYDDSSCTTPGSVPFLYIATGQCVPNTDGGNSYKMTISGSTVTTQLFTDLACQMPASSSTTVTYTVTQGSSGCVSTTIPSTTFITVKLLSVAPGELPKGYYYGTYMLVMTSQTACNAFTTSNIVNGMVAALPFSIIGSSGDYPFGITYNVAQAFSCSTDGKRVIVTAWKTKVNSGNLTVVEAMSVTGSFPLGRCNPVGQGTTLYYRLVCI